MAFRELKEEIKKIPILPIISYCSVMLFAGSITKELSNLGNWSYVLFMIALPSFVGSLNWLTDGNLLKAFRRDWINLSPSTHFLIVILASICLTLSPQIKKIWTKEIFGK